ncbi:hypothetical protein BDV96DRAFT_613861 [Lophiotrema nucula]|uniref:DUF7730 domain-containing protein n=1 Tax=Lophiotrema nucula TaxID=690887 RepID=A0A6A5Z099_9PLEO|nr:hypothetical protein BDV96DRAFT_613861 [Lophiotrema nucula]
MSLFSRARQSLPSSPKKKVRGFLGLPGELRNKIYDCYFEDTGGLRVEIAAHGTHLGDTGLQKIARCSNASDTTHKQPTIRMPRRLGNYKRVDGPQTRWATSLCALILVCRQVYQESILFLYRNTTFVFAAPRRIANFLYVIPKRNLSNITMLHLHYNSYGPPFSNAHVVWQEKHIKRWSSICRTLSKSLASLQELHLKVDINETDFRMDLRQPWLQPLLQLRRMCNRRGDMGPSELPSSSGAVIYDNPRLAEASRNLHRLFGEAISLAILGASEEVAMTGFNEAWNGKYEEWHHYLNYSDTGW